ncbi:MAG TPA: adenylate/guanylate cyclase domain-containing protein [Candidatus Norongarragalinales archaeon]|nr:adenylate/guanylate cyclase domain-containing protein [Candidatus Norongarragalinales archaeon]
MASAWQILYVITLAVLGYGFVRSFQEYQKGRQLVYVLLSSILLVVITDLWSQAYGTRFKDLFDRYRLFLLFLPLGAFLAYQYWEERRHSVDVDRAKIRDMFQKYLDPNVVDRVMQQDFTLKGRKQEVTVLVTDLRGSTKMCVDHPPEVVVRSLNDYFEATISVIKKNGGMVDKITGDGVMALFNTPLPSKDHFIEAYKTAVELHERVRDLNVRLKKKGLPHLAMGIGLDVGVGVVGNIGSRQLARFTVIGDVANTASRVQAYAEEGEIILTEDAYHRLKGTVKAKGPFKVNLRGKGPTKIYKVAVYRT